MTLQLTNVQIDVPADSHGGAVDFWASALGATPRPTNGPFTHLLGARALVGVHLQQLDDGVAGVHLDLVADDVDAEVARLKDLGADPVGEGPCVVLADPGGNRLCVCGGDGPPEQLRSDADGARLHVLVVDVASAHAADTASFWAAALGVTAEPLAGPYAAYHRLEDVPVPGGKMRILVQDIGSAAEPRIHLDLHVADPGARDAEVERLADLGAEVVDRTQPWTVLTDPVGTVFCVVPDEDGS